MGNAPKDTNAKHAKKDRSKSEGEKLDEALGETFPASDPPSVTDPTKHVGSDKTDKNQEHKPERG